MARSRITTSVSTIGDLLVRAAGRHPDRAIIALPHARATYAEVESGATALARGLIGLGIGPGAHVGLLATNGVDFVEAFFAATLLGCVVVPLNARHKTTELTYIINHADLAALIVSNDDNAPVDFGSVLVELFPTLATQTPATPLSLASAPMLRHIVKLRGAATPGTIGREQLAATAGPVPATAVEAARRAVRVRDPALMIYTSGTTANPKGCLLPHEAATRGPVERARHRLSASNGTDAAWDVTWGAGPLFHIGSLAPFIGSVGAGGTYLTDVVFDPGRAVDLMNAEGVTLAWPWFSAIVQGLIDHPRFDPEKLGSLRHLFMIAPDTLVQRVIDLLPRCEVLQACGMTETAGVFALSDPDERVESRIRTQGRASPGIGIRIVSPDTGEDCPPGQMGEIWVRGYCVMDGYYKDAEKTAASLTPDGWLKTGDLYVREASGSLIFNGRLKDMLKVGGENVAAIEVEAYLCSHPDVKLAEVVGRPDPRLDEVPVAFVELREGSSLQPDALIAFCEGKIARYKIPRAVFFMQPGDWPMSATKVDKRALRARLT